MKTGYFLPQIGPASSPENMITVAQRAEELGCETVWVTDRLLYPTDPRTPYAGTPDGSLPDVYKRVFDPVESLTFVAARTSRIRLGTSVLDMPFYNPLMLGRRLTTLDVISNGRLTVGMGLGWSADEYEAMNAPMKERGSRADEFIDALKTIMAEELVEFSGEHYKIAQSIIELSAVQRPHPPIYLAAFSPAGLRRVALKADGWHPVAIPPDGVRPMWDSVLSMAREAGRNPDELKLIYRANIAVTDKPIDGERFTFTGTWEQIASDVAAVKALGAHELCIDPTFSPEGQTVDGFLSALDKVKQIAA
jgi:probable F420-dependent oxidoreductase